MLELSFFMNEYSSEVSVLSMFLLVGLGFFGFIYVFDVPGKSSSPTLLIAVIMFLSYFGLIYLDFKSDAIVKGFTNNKLAEVYQEVSREYGLNIETGTKLKCISGYWLHKPEWSEHSWHFEPKVSCSHDRGIENRLKEKWPADLHFPTELVDEDTDLNKTDKK
jgi:hypothetical protein